MDRRTDEYTFEYMMIGSTVLISTDDDNVFTGLFFHDHQMKLNFTYPGDATDTSYECPSTSYLMKIVEVKIPS